MSIMPVCRLQDRPRRVGNERTPSDEYVRSLCRKRGVIDSRQSFDIVE